MNRIHAGTAIEGNIRLEYFLEEQPSVQKSDSTAPNYPNYLVSIEKTEFETASASIPCEKNSALKFLEKLRRNSVFPSTLSEIIEDYKFSQTS